MPERISRRPDELSQQCDRASHAIGGEPNWPPTAPIAMTLLTCSQNIETQLSVINSLESQLREARHAMKPFVEAAHDNMVKVDQATDHSEMKHSQARYCAGTQRKRHYREHPRHSRESGNPVRILRGARGVLDSRFRACRFNAL